MRQIDGRGFVDNASVGDVVSIHWGWACEVLSLTQQQRLERYTRHHLAHREPDDLSAILQSQLALPTRPWNPACPNCEHRP